MRVTRSSGLQMRQVSGTISSAATGDVLSMHCSSPSGKLQHKRAETRLPRYVHIAIQSARLAAEHPCQQAEPSGNALRCGSCGRGEPGSWHTAGFDP